MGKLLGKHLSWSLSFFTENLQLSAADISISVYETFGNWSHNDN